MSTSTLEKPKQKIINVNLQVPELYPKQAEFFNSPARFACCEASSKSGKTISALLWLTMKALNADRPGKNYLWLSPIHQTALIGYLKLKEWLSNYPELVKFNESKSSATFSNGSTIYFRGSDDPDSIYGWEYWAFIADEASRIKEDAWIALRSTITYTGAPGKLIGNVKNRNNWFWRMCRKAQAGDPNMSYHKITCLDCIEAGLFSQEEIDDARANMPPEAFEALYMAEAGENEASPFRNLNQVIVDAVEPGEVVQYGLDIGRIIDYTVLTGLDRNGNVVYWNRWKLPWDDCVDEVANIIKDIPCLMDSTGNGDGILAWLQTKADYVEGFVFTAKSKQQLFEELALSIQQRKLQIPKKLDILIDEMENFTYEYTATGIRYSAPSGLHDDACCSLALANKALYYGAVEAGITFF